MGRRLDLHSGDVFGNWTLIKFDKKKIKWLCKCKCGTIRHVDASALNKGKSLSCGCLKYERILKEGRRDVRSERLYGIYSGMKARCYNPHRQKYKNYGGRGITVCDEWLGNGGYKRFKEWAMSNGYKEDAKYQECTLDRIDNNANYTPENCRWVSNDVQANNKRTNRILELNGERMTLAEWSKKIGIKADTIQARIDYHHWTVEEALTLPIGARVNEHRNKSISAGQKPQL